MTARARISLLAAASLLTFHAIQGQTGSTPLPTFDVASVRPSEPFDSARMQAAMQAGKMPKFGADIEGLRAEYSQMQMRDLVANAYAVKPYQVTISDAVNTQRWDIAARMPEGAKPEDAPGMLQSLLKERFKLEAVKSTQEHAVQLLVVAKGGAKLKQSAGKPLPLDPNYELKDGEMKINGPFGPMIITRNKDGSSVANMGAQGKYTQRFDGKNQMLHLEGTAISMDGLAQMVTMMTMGGPGNSSARQVVNKTGLTGFYDIVIDVSLGAMRPPPPPPGPGNDAAQAQAPDPGGGGLTVNDSLQKMGLKLEPGKAAVDQVVVGHVEKTPTEN